MILMEWLRIVKDRGLKAGCQNLPNVGVGPRAEGRRLAFTGGTGVFTSVPFDVPCDQLNLA